MVPDEGKLFFRTILPRYSPSMHPTGNRNQFNPIRLNNLTHCFTCPLSAKASRNSTAVNLALSSPLIACFTVELRCQCVWDIIVRKLNTMHCRFASVDNRNNSSSNLRIMTGERFKLSNHFLTLSNLIGSLSEGYPLLPALVSMNSKELYRRYQVRLALVDSIILQALRASKVKCSLNSSSRLQVGSSSEGIGAGTMEMERVQSNPGSS
jgi:transcription elongation factor Elf1